MITLTFFLLLDGRGMVERGTGRLPEPQRGRARRIAGRVAEVVKAYVSVNLLPRDRAPASSPGGSCRRSGFHLAVPLAVLVAFLDLIPLIGLTVGGFAVFAVADDRRWSRRRDRLAGPLPGLPAAPGPRHPAALYKGGALKVNPAVAIVAVIVGAELAGVLGALLAIPTAASLGVVIDELVLSGPPGAAGPEPEPSE